MAFQRAERKKAKARIGLCGPAGSGKTYSALKVAFGIGGKIAVIDTEHGSAELYSHLGEYDVARIEPPFTPEKYTALIHEAEKAGYDTIVIDSLSHAWAGQGGLLEFVDNKSASANKFAAWREATPKHNALVESILQSKSHIIATMRSKTEYVVEQNEKGKAVPRKVGMAPVQRDGMEYEFTIVFEIEQSRHVATTSKDRTDLFNGFCEVLNEEHGKKISDWLNGGAEDHKANYRQVEKELDGAFTPSDVDGILKNRAAWIKAMPKAGAEKLKEIAAARRVELGGEVVNG